MLLFVFWIRNLLKMVIPKFDEQALKNFAGVLANVLTHSKITEMLMMCNIPPAEGSNKQDRLYYAFKSIQDKNGCANNVVDFIQKTISPRRYDDNEKYEKDRTSINEKLLYEGYEINEKGQMQQCKKAQTISEAKERSQKIKTKIRGMKIHSEIIRYCDEEWLNEDYFHAMEEVAKSVFDRLRQITGIQQDGAALVANCFAIGQSGFPLLALNKLETLNEKSEQTGFMNFCTGFYGLYRNPKAHNARVNEDVKLEQFAEVLVVASIIHERLDHVYLTRR